LEQSAIQLMTVASAATLIVLVIQLRNIKLSKYRTEQRTSQFNHMVDAAGSGSELLEFLRSGEGRQVMRMLATQGDASGGSGKAYVWAAVFTTLGFGLFILGFSAIDSMVPGTLSLCLGLGLFAGETIRRKADRQRQEDYMREVEAWNLGAPN